MESEISTHAFLHYCRSDKIKQYNTYTLSAGSLCFKQANERGGGKRKKKGSNRKRG